MDDVSATLWNHVHVHIFQNLNNFFPKWKSKVVRYHSILSFEIYENECTFIVYFLTSDILNHPGPENYPNEKVLRGNKLTLCF